MQAFPNMVLGNTPVDWSRFGKFDEQGQAGEQLRRALWHMWERDLVYTWAHDNSYQQWWVDALTIDPSKLLEDEVGIVEAGMEPILVEADLANAAMGSVPLMQVRCHTPLIPHLDQHVRACSLVVGAQVATGGADRRFELQVYIAVNATHGTKAFFPHNSLRRGKQDSHSDVKLWTTKLTDKQRDFIISKSYYNQEAALEKFKARGSAERQALFKADTFDLINFLVRTARLLQAATSPAEYCCTRACNVCAMSSDHSAML